MKVATDNCGLEKYAQVISSEMMAALKESAQARGISLDAEIALRLTTYMAEPELAKDNALSQQILRLDFTEAQAIAECKHKRKATLYLYEMERLRLFLRLEHGLPRGVKERFILIDVKEATKPIKAELAAERKANKED